MSFIGPRLWTPIALAVCCSALPPTLPAVEPLLEKTNLFEAGTDGYTLYRIPGIVATTRGTLLAYCEARKGKGNDWDAIDVMLRRSTDGGKTWEPRRKLVEPGDKVPKNPVAVKQKLGKPGEVTVNNPVAFVDRQTGAVHFLYCIEYARCYYMRSDDDGKTFSTPVDITATIEKFRPEYNWQAFATGPGHGIQLRNGRLLVPVWLSTGEGGNAHRPSALSTIYSEDHGTTWNRGQIVAANPKPINPNETVAVQLHDGSVMLNIRHEDTPRHRGVSISADGATGWSPLRFDPQLPDPVCMGSIIRFSEQPAQARNRLLFSNLHNPDDRRRKNLTIKLSYDEGKTWSVAKALEPGVSGYSDLAVGPDGTIYCFYERGSARDSQYKTSALCVARFNLDWLTDGKDQGQAGVRRSADKEELWTAKPLTETNSFTAGIEGPNCDAQGNIYAVNFARQGTIGKVTPDGKGEVFVELPNKSVGNGIVFDRKGIMYVADYVNHNVLRIDPRTKAVTVFAHEAKMNQPNDLAIALDGTLYASDPNWGKNTGQIWRIDPAGKVTLAAGNLGTTNGIEVSPDGKTLFVNESVQRNIWAFPLAADGSLGEKRLVKKFDDHGFDGMRCDVDGNLYITRYGKGTVVKLSPDGKVLREIDVLGPAPSNLCFGGPDGRTVYVTEVKNRRLVQFRVDRPGLAWQRWQKN